MEVFYAKRKKNMLSFLKVVAKYLNSSSKEYSTVVIQNTHIYTYTYTHWHIKHAGEATINCYTR